MADTVGSLVDKISIVELKLYHMREFAAREHDRNRRSPEPTRSTMRKINALCAQRDELAAELTQIDEAVKPTSCPVCGEPEPAGSFCNHPHGIPHERWPRG